MVLTGSDLPNVLASGISSIRWPLGPSSCSPLYYQPLESLKALRKTPALDLVQDLPTTIEALFPPTDTDKRHFGLVATALILIGNDFTDECHNIITPLSWPDDIHFAHGPSVFSQVSPEARAYATYVHCLVHRKEAFHVGEFGMLGFSNANFWSRAVATSPGVNLLPHVMWVSEIRALAERSSSLEVRDWLSRHVPNDSFFDSRVVHELCANVLREKVMTTSPLREFAEQVAEMEVRVLLAHALQKAGFDVPIDSILRRDIQSLESKQVELSAVTIDKSIALTAARKVSSAHLHHFKSSGSIVLRDVLRGGDATSAAAGVACRLFESPACRLVTREDCDALLEQRLLFVALPQSEEQARELEHSSGVSMSPGDLLAMIASDRLTMEEERWLVFAPSDASSRVDFVDPLYGTRGETPTTVIQWSKGTIF